MDINYSGIGRPKFTVSFEIGEMHERDKKALFSTLISDIDVMQGRHDLSAAEEKQFLALLDKRCGWEKKR